VTNTLNNYEWSQYARVLYYTKQERLAKDKLSSLLGPFFYKYSPWSPALEMLRHSE
jgi:hypothetical protein